LLYDIGKMGLPDQLLDTPDSALTIEQRKQVEKHPVLGQAILMGLEPLQGAARLIRHHHERWDGKGYPDRLVGEDIPRGARVLAVLNDYDSLISGAMLGESFRPQEAREFIAERSGRRYDPDLVIHILDFLENRAAPAEFGIPELHLRPERLKPGMVLSRDLRMPNGMLLLSSDYQLNEALVERILAFQRDSERPFMVHVHAPEEAT